MPKELSELEIKLQAMSYVMLATLQKLDQAEPGFIAELLNGVTADREAATAHPDATSQVQATFQEALNILKRAELPSVP